MTMNSKTGELAAAKTISQIVATALEGQTQAYLEDVAAHGIHNITNDYASNTDDEYQSYADEFGRQATAALATIEAQRDDE